MARRFFSSNFPIERVGEDPDIEGETSRLAMTSSPGSANPWPESPTNVTNDQWPMTRLLLSVLVSSFGPHCDSNFDSSCTYRYYKNPQSWLRIASILSDAGASLTNSARASLARIKFPVLTDTLNNSNHTSGAWLPSEARRFSSS